MNTEFRKTLPGSPLDYFDARAAVEALADTHRVLLITKGDLVHQTHKITTSGLAHHFGQHEWIFAADDGQEGGFQPAQQLRFAHGFHLDGFMGRYSLLVGQRQGQSQHKKHRH